MIEEVDNRLKDWIIEVLGKTVISLGPPENLPAKPETGISLYLMEVCHVPSPRGIKKDFHKISLRYLVSEKPVNSQIPRRALGELIFSAMEHPEFEVELETVTPSIWLAFSVTPRPSFVLRVPLQRQQPTKKAALVRQPLVLKKTQMNGLYGQVVGPGENPIMGARIGVPALNLSTHTDSQGRFFFPGIPIGPQPTVLNVRAKGQEQSIQTQPGETDKESFVIRLEPTEN